MMPRNENGKVILRCPKCSHTVKKIDTETKIIKDTVKNRDRTVEVVDEHEEKLPTTEIECRRCANTTAYFWSKQTRAGDEAETRFFRCTNCGNTWREYD